MSEYRVGVIGCGLIGERRAIEAEAHPSSRCLVVYDVQSDTASRVAAKVGAVTAADWQSVATSNEIDIVCIATPNKFLVPMADVAMRSGKHVLIEKPMGRNVREAKALLEAVGETGRLLKIGFNHRYHPAIRRLHEEITSGRLGRLINARCRYGHGARPGYEHEWRGNPELSGGGELTDQGVHVVDLFHWMLGRPRDVIGVTQNAVWPLNGLEDNGFAIIRYTENVVATLHTSWTQWKNLFSLEIFGELGSAVVEGLGRSYGTETLTLARRKPEGGAPEIESIQFEGPDESWHDEWTQFVSAIADGTPYWGTPDDGVMAMATLDALYRSAASGSFELVD